jgi:cytochrome c oxidase subunit 2
MEDEVSRWVPIWPGVAANTGEVVNTIFIGLLAVAVFICVLSYGLVTTFAIRYRKGSAAERGSQTSKTWRWEIGWTAATLAAFLLLFIWGAGAYVWLYQPPASGDEILVTGKQWMWKVQHPEGAREINELHVPLGRPTRLVLASEDVIHSFFIPAFRVKHDVLPGAYETMWFTPTRAGAFTIFCAEFCGLEHAHMGGRVVVMRPADYERWLAAQPPSDSLARQGEALFRRAGCAGCHGPNSTAHAPPLEGIYGKPVQLADGTSVVADDRYIHDSILLPKAQIVAGYAPIMPSFAGQLGEEEVFELVAYIKSLSTASRAAP